MQLTVFPMSGWFFCLSYAELMSRYQRVNEDVVPFSTRHERPTVSKCHRVVTLQRVEPRITRAITLCLSCPKIASWWTFRHEAIVKMLMSCSNIAPGLTDDDTTSSFCMHPETTVQSFHPRLWRLSHWHNIQILLHFADVETHKMRPCFVVLNSSFIFHLYGSVFLNILNTPSSLCSLLSKYHEKNQI